MFLAACFIIGPEQVHALHVEALCANLAAGSAIGLNEDVTVDYAYDDNGNMIQRVSSVAGTTNYTYDSDNRLMKVADPNGSLASVTTYAYDTDGIRTAKITGAGATTYLTDKNRDYAQVLEERNADTRTLDVRYTYGHDLISQHRPDGQSAFNTHYYHYDGQLSIRQLSDDQGDPTDSYTYDAFGELLDSSGGTVNNYLYTGEQFDASTGFYYLRARYYDHAIGRFATRDTYIGDASDPISFHKYVYADADPSNRYDPSGHNSLVISFIPTAIILLTIASLAVLNGRNTSSITTPSWKFIPVERSRLKVREHAIRIRWSRLSADELFELMTRLSQRNLYPATASRDARPGEIISFDLSGIIREFGQGDFEVRVTQFDRSARYFVARTLGGHPLAGWRYWGVEKERNGDISIRTFDVTHPATIVDSLKLNRFFGGRDDAEQTWTSLLNDLQRHSQGAYVGGPIYGENKSNVDRYLALVDK